MPEIVQSEYSLNEEWANSLTHAFGLILSVVGLVLLMIATSSGGFREVASCALYGATLILVYSTSTLYHGVRHVPSKRVLQTLDHVAIFLLIAGTYTPFVLIALRGAWGWSLFAIVWILAVLGVVFELTRVRHIRGVMIALYIGMGWVGLIAVKPLVAALPTGGLALVLGGGVSYTLGVFFYSWRTLRYHHAVWHLFVLGGSVLQYLAVLWYVAARAVMSEFVVHRGSCHCGRVRFEVDAPPKINALDCDCSICKMTGYLHLIVPASRFRLLAGADDVREYTFNTGTAKHLFCRVCGIKSFYVPRSNPDGIDVNVRCLDTSAIDAVEVTAFHDDDREASMSAIRLLSI